MIFLIRFAYELEIIVLMTPGINSGVTMSAIPDGIGYSYGLEILVLMTPLYFANAIKKRIVIPTERTPVANGGIR